jgi:uncharacterized transporter YbjL
VLKIGDEITVVGKLERFIEAPRLVGPEISDPDMLDIETESARVVVTRGDVLSVTGPSANIEQLGERLGHLERPLEDTDLLTLALGIQPGSRWARFPSRSRACQWGSGWLVGSQLLHLNPAVLLGAITGAMTSAALSVVNAAARSSVPALGYTGAYAFANVILTVAGSLIVHL